MKRVISNILTFLLSVTFVFGVFIYIFEISVVTVGLLLIIFVIYGLCMGICEKSMRQLKKYEQKSIHIGLIEKDHSKILWFSILSLFPTYFCIFMVSLVPLFTYEIWFITAFPCILMNCFPAISIFEEYHGLTRKKLPFLMLFFIITAVCCILGISVASNFK